MRRKTKHISLVHTAFVSNIWVLTDEENRRFIIDTGHRSERLSIKVALWRMGIRKPGDVEAILLTHRHSDHAGNARWLRKRFQSPVICHENDAPYLNGEKAPPKMARAIGNRLDDMMCFVEDTFPAKTEVDSTFAVGQWRYGFDIRPAFGHTEGSVLLFHEPTASLFTGDALLSGPPPMRIFEQFFLSIPAYSVDVEACHGHVMRFLSDMPKVASLCSGHGPLVTEQTADKLYRFYLSRLCDKSAKN